MGKESNSDTLSGQKVVKTASAMSPLEVAIIRTLLYFDLFKYPLKADEVVRTCSVYHNDPPQVLAALDKLTSGGMVTKEGEYYFVGNGEGYVHRREKGNVLADKRLKKARQVSHFIGRFPYVRAVMVSGSLSKHYMEPDSDLDFFVVTRPGRLWVARTFLILYKKIFILNSHYNFCVNYFVDSDHLEVQDRNVFTATELVYLLPTVNPELYLKLRAANDWADTYYPNFGPRDTSEVHPLRGSWWGNAWEKILNGNWGERLDAWCMRKTLARWKSKFSHFDERKFDVTLRTRPYVSKHHPSDFQQKVIQGLAKKVEEFENRNKVKLSS